MRRSNSDFSGFSLVEVVIAMLLLGLIVIAFIPPLWQGLRYSIEQADVATATRHVNALIEQARKDPSCTKQQPPGTPRFPNPSASLGYTGANGKTVTITATSGPSDPSNPMMPSYACTPGVPVTVVLTARNADASVLAVVSARILMNP